MLAPALLAATLLIEPTPSPIVGGELVEDAEFDSVAAVVIPVGGGVAVLCTATAVHPRLLLTAAHCLDDEGLAPDDIKIYLGNDLDQALFQATVESFAPHPDFCRNCDEDISDFGYIVIEEELAGDLEDFPRPFVSQDDFDRFLADGDSVMLVGFGRDDEGETGLKRKVETTISNYTAGGHEFLAGGGGKDTCVGDSGGPAFAKDADGRWRLGGITSRGYPDCGQGGLYTVPFSHLCWVAEETGIDLLPQGCKDCQCVDTAPPPEKGCNCVLAPGRSQGRSATGMGSLPLGLAALMWWRRRTRRPRRRHRSSA